MDTVGGMRPLFLDSPFSPHNPVDTLKKKKHHHQQHQLVAEDGIEGILFISSYSGFGKPGVGLKHYKSTGSIL